MFIEAAFLVIDKAEIRVLEVGFGTGLNALLASIYARTKGVKINYTSIEKYPLDEAVWGFLNYGEIMHENDFFQCINKSEWEKEIQISEDFTLQKIKADLNSISFSTTFDCIFFDAFSPDKQPELWTNQVFEKLFACTANNGILTTYCAKGAVRRAMQLAGYQVERIPGPTGKREMLRARKM